MGIDFDKSCKYAYEANNDAIFIGEDISKIKGKDIKNMEREKSKDSCRLRPLPTIFNARQ